MGEKRPDPNEWRRWLWKCNGCNQLRTPLVGYCQACGSPEFTLIARAEVDGCQLSLFGGFVK